MIGHSEQGAFDGKIKMQMKRPKPINDPYNRL